MKISQLDYRESYVTENMMLAGLNGFINSFLRTRSEGAPIWCVKVSIFPRTCILFKIIKINNHFLFLRKRSWGSLSTQIWS